MFQLIYLQHERGQFSNKADDGGLCARQLAQSTLAAPIHIKVRCCLGHSFLVLLAAIATCHLDLPSKGNLVQGGSLVAASIGYTLGIGCSVCTESTPPRAALSQWLHSPGIIENGHSAQCRTLALGLPVLDWDSLRAAVISEALQEPDLH